MGTEDFELTLFDRLNVIRDTIAKYGEENFYLSFSGGKDSTILSHMIDEALPGNRIPRVYIDTGIEYQMIRQFVADMASKDDRIIMLKPTKPIKKILETYGYPFKSKEHSLKIGMWQRGSRCSSVVAYAQVGAVYKCPTKLGYQLSPDFKLRLSPMCCTKLKKEPAKRYEKESGRHIGILGLRKGEGGQRMGNVGCTAFRGGTLVKFKPLHPVSEDFMDWYMESRAIRLCDLYYPPYSFTRTGCKGCPFNRSLRRDLETMERYLPAERAQCEFIWKPVYEEYRRIGYRLKKNEQLKLF